METTELILRLFVAALLGGLIGLEREYRAKEAGVRTHFLVALGSGLFMIISQYGFDGVLRAVPEAHLDPSRVAAQVVAGIGFIGAGTIILQKHVVKGLTTAAGLWVTSAIGMTCGSGLYLLAAATTLMVLICLEALTIGIQRFGYRAVSLSFAVPTKEHATRILDAMRGKGIEVDSYNMKLLSADASMPYHVSLEAKAPRRLDRRELLELINEYGNATLTSME